LYSAAVTRIEVRAAQAEDLPDIAAVALAAGQDDEWAGADPAYMTHLLTHGRVLVGVSGGGAVVGFGATRRLGTAASPVTMLSDLFVHPRVHGSGCGQALLAGLWGGGGQRMTFSSRHANALPLYTRFGLDAWWPLLYLHGPVAALTVPDGWLAVAETPAEVAALELDWTGVDRSADHLAWAGRPHGASVLARHGGQPMAAGTVGGAGGEYGLIHLALAPSAAGEDAATAVLTVLSSLVPPGGQARVCLPGPHPAVRALLADGWRVGEFDLFMATEPDLLDPRRAVPSPALA